MNCAGCDKEHKGIEGLMPREDPGRVGGHKKYRMLCSDCHKAAQRERDEYQQASRGQ